MTLDKKLVSRVFAKVRWNPANQATKPFSGRDEVILKQISAYGSYVISAGRA